MNRLCFECPLDDCKTPCPFGVDDNDCADEFLVDDFKKKEDVKEYRRSYYQKHKEKFNNYMKNKYKLLEGR